MAAVELEMLLFEVCSGTWEIMLLPTVLDGSEDFEDVVDKASASP